MSPLSKRLLFWTPRVLGIAFALFLSLFALDVFEPGRGFWPTLAALLIHLIPVFFLLATLAVAWRWEWVGTVIFAALGILYIVWAPTRGLHWMALVIVSGPLFLLAALFLANWLKHADLRARP
jgi:hypothetical protein